MDCPCCSGKAYEVCCMPYHDGDAFAPNAEALMRSRYAAFAVHDADYLFETTLPARRKFHRKNEYLQWAEENEWIKLEIVDTPAPNIVEFKAYFKMKNGQLYIQHERSRFKQVNAKWYYADGENLSAEQ